MRFTYLNLSMLPFDLDFWDVKPVARSFWLAFCHPYSSNMKFLTGILDLRQDNYHSTPVGGTVSTLCDFWLRFPNLYIDTSAYVPSRYPKALVEYMRGRGAKRVTESLFPIPCGQET